MVKLSIIVVAYNMSRELPRTIHSLSARYQKMVDSDDYEVIVIDNGSDKPISRSDFGDLSMRLSIIRYPNGLYPSPCIPINEAVNLSKGTYVGVLIDGARILSPGILHKSIELLNKFSNSVIETLSWHLGGEPQSISMRKGYCQAEEDRLLATVDWQNNGYELFNISCLGHSSKNGYFGAIAESNALFMSRDVYNKIGGYNSEFKLPGGGFANLDFYYRAVNIEGVSVIRLYQEGTFHQFHGGVATNDLTGFYVSSAGNEYLAIVGHQHKMPKINHMLYCAEMRAAI